MANTASPISAEQFAVLEGYIGNNDRVAFYLKLNEYSGSKTALFGVHPL